MGSNSHWLRGTACGFCAPCAAAAGSPAGAAACTEQVWSRCEFSVRKQHAIEGGQSRPVQKVGGALCMGPCAPGMRVMPQQVCMHELCRNWSEHPVSALLLKHQYVISS